MDDLRTARLTYRYLRLALVGAVVLASVSILLERRDGAVHCFQTSVSAYYYTPVRAIFVGTLFAIGFALIVIQGSNAVEDSFLNFAGILAPLVAIVPTTSVGTCWSVAPEQFPLTKDGSLTEVFVANIDNNVVALLITASLGLLFGVLFLLWRHRGVAQLKGVAERSSPGAPYTLLGASVFVVIVWVAYLAFREDFYDYAHMVSAFLFVGCLWVAVIANAWQHRDRATRADAVYFWLYTAVAVLMALSLGGVLLARPGWAHWVAGLEALELLWFATFWIAQTIEHWSERKLLI